MTPADIIVKLFVPVDADRVQKAKGMAARAKIEWAAVLAAMTDEQLKQVEAAH